MKTSRRGMCCKVALRFAARARRLGVDRSTIQLLLDDIANGDLCALVYLGTLAAEW
jgi:hypothetical protein